MEAGQLYWVVVVELQRVGVGVLEAGSLWEKGGELQHKICTHARTYAHTHACTHTFCWWRRWWWRRKTRSSSHLRRDWWGGLLLDYSGCYFWRRRLWCGRRLCYSGRSFTCPLQLNVENHGWVKGCFWKGKRIRHSSKQRPHKQ